MTGDPRARDPGAPLRLLLGTANRGKLRELRAILAGVPVELVGLAEAGLGQPPEVAETDMNVVMTGLGGLVEVQGTAERAPFSREELDAMLDLAGQGVAELVLAQKLALGGLLEEAAIPPLRRIALGPPRPAAKA